MRTISTLSGNDADDLAHEHRALPASLQVSGVGGALHREVLLFWDDIPKYCDRHLGSRYEIEVINPYVVHLSFLI